MNLIWFLSIGDLYHKEMCKLAILAIKTWTNYSGEIVVLSDEDHLPDCLEEQYDNIRVYNIIRHDLIKSRKISNKFNIFCLKPLIKDYVNLSEYKFVLYLDSDVLVKLPHFDEVLNFWGNIGKITFADNENWGVEQNIPSTGSQVLTEEEKIKHKKFGVCAGMLGLPGNLAKDFLTDWWVNNLKYNLEYDDQGILTSMIIRNNYDYHQMDFLNKNRWKSEGITHYHSKYKRRFWEHARFLLREFNEPNDFTGTWRMKKPSENVENIWTIERDNVWVDNPMITGKLQHTKFGSYVWWDSIDGFEILKKDRCVSFKGGQFTLTNIE